MNWFTRAVVRAHLWAYQTGELHLSEHEEVVKDSYGWLIGKYLGMRGRIVLTNRRLIFVSDSARLVGPDQIRLDVELAATDGAKMGSRLQFKAAVPGVPTFSITTAGEEYEFQTGDASTLVGLILERRGAGTTRAAKS